MATETQIPSAITVDYEFIDGAHFFTSHHPVAVGLCAASTDLKAAFEDVSVQIAELLKDNYGVTALCEPSVSYEKFVFGMLRSLKEELARLQAKAAPAGRYPRITSGAAPAKSTIDWRVPILEDA